MELNKYIRIKFYYMSYLFLVAHVVKFNTDVFIQFHFAIRLSFYVQANYVSSNSVRLRTDGQDLVNIIGFDIFCL